MLTIWKLLKQGVIVAADEEQGLLVLWNMGTILRLFHVCEGSYKIHAHGKDEVHAAHAFNEVDAHQMGERYRVVGYAAGTWRPIRKEVRITEARAIKEAEKWLKQLAQQQ